MSTERPRELFVPAEPPELVFEVKSAEGSEAEALRIEQARILREVAQWVAQKRSEGGQDRAA